MNITNITISNEALEGLISSAFNAARQVGRREAKRANVYAVVNALPSGNQVDFQTTFDNHVPGFFAILIASARWSVSRGEYVVTANEFLTRDLVKVDHLGKERSGTFYDVVVDALDRGVSKGVEEAKEAQAINEKAETVGDRIVVLMNLMSGGRSAWFFDREDAELWAGQEVGTKNVRWSVVAQTEADGDMAKIILQDREETTVWRAWVSNEPA